MKIGVFGGAFDPPHNEHINLCLAAKEELGLDKVIIVPSGLQPHKSSEVSPNMRYDMIKVAARNHKCLIVDDTEVKYSRVGYAIDILPLLHIKYGEFIYIIGGDSFVNINNWMRPDIILSSYPIAVVARGNHRCEINKLINYYQELYNSDIKLLNYRAEQISSSLVRAKLKLNENVQGIISDNVYEMIRHNNLYSNYRDMVDKVKSMLSKTTYHHTVRTIMKALEFNQAINLPFEKVFVSCLLHDISKETPLDDRYRYAVPMKAENSPVMHAFQGVGIAEQVFKIEDREIVNAIKYHTTGRAKMTKLEILVYIADLLEEGREFPEVEGLRRIVAEDFILGFLSCVEHHYKYLINTGKSIYPLTEECYNYYIKKELQ